MGINLAAVNAEIGSMPLNPLTSFPSPNAITEKAPEINIAVMACEKPIGLTSESIFDDNAIAVDIPTKIKGIKITAFAAPNRLRSPKALNNLPRLKEITANAPAINIEVATCDNPTGLTSDKIYDDNAIAVENPTIINIIDGIFLGSTSILAILSNAIAIRGKARAKAKTLTKLTFPTIFSASPIATIPAAININVPTPSLIFVVSNPNPFFFFSLDSSSSLSFSFSLPTSTEVSPFGTLVIFLESSFFSSFSIFIIVSWLSNILVSSSFLSLSAPILTEVSSFGNLVIFLGSSFFSSLSFSLPTSTEVSPFGNSVVFLGSSFFLELRIFNIVSWLSNILAVSSFKDNIPECISLICLPNSPL